MQSTIFITSDMTYDHIDMACLCTAVLSKIEECNIHLTNVRLLLKLVICVQRVSLFLSHPLFIPSLSLLFPAIPT